MTEEEKEQTTEAANAEDGVSDETETGPVQVPGGVGEPIPMPAAGSDTGTAPQAESAPDQPDTPPMGVPHDPAGSYAMGALAGNPNLATPPPGPPPPPPPYGAYGPYGAYPPYGAPYSGPYAGPYGDPHTPTWGMPPAARHDREHKVRNAVLAGCAAVAILAAGIGIGDAAWNNRTPTQSASGPFNGQLPNRSGGSPFNNGGPFGGSGNSGNSGGGSSNNSGPSDVDAIAAKVDPGLVDINTTLGYQQEQAAGTGIVLTSNGVVLTNNHVINGATSISVTDVGNQKTYTANVLGYDRTHDIAVLQLHNASGLQTATMSTSSVSVGQDVVGVGNAGGTGGTPSAAGGTVTALNQTITASDEGDGTSEALSGLIETNANIQPGDSGGALVNTNGQVVGVDTAASAGYSFQFNGQSGGNQGFAIPINTALSIAHQIESGNGSSTVHIGPTAFLGVEISPNGGSTGGDNGGGFGGFGGFFGGNSGNTGSSSTSGAAVAGVVTNGPAQEAGLAQGDVITSLGSKSIGSANDLTSAMLTHHPGDKVSVAWTDSSGQTHSATVQLSSGPPQ